MASPQPSLAVAVAGVVEVAKAVTQLAFDHEVAHGGGAPTLSVRRKRGGGCVRPQRVNKHIVATANGAGGSSRIEYAVWLGPAPAAPHASSAHRRPCVCHVSCAGTGGC